MPKLLYFILLVIPCFQLCAYDGVYEAKGDVISMQPLESHIHVLNQMLDHVYTIPELVQNVRGYTYQFPDIVNSLPGQRMIGHKIQEIMTQLQQQLNAYQTMAMGRPVRHSLEQFPNIIPASNQNLNTMIQSINNKNDTGKTALLVLLWNLYFVPSDQGYALAASLLINGADANIVNDQGNTPLLLAASLDDSRFAQLLLHYGAHINQQDEYGFTPLLKAIRDRKKDVVVLLLQAGANINIPNRRGQDAQALARDQFDPAIPDSYVIRDLINNAVADQFLAW